MHGPDVVVMGLQMPHVAGVTATRQIAEALPDVRLLALTMFEDDDSGFSAMRAGAQGYLVKGADSPDVERAITAVRAARRSSALVSPRGCSTTSPGRCPRGLADRVGSEKSTAVTSA